MTEHTAENNQTPAGGHGSRDGLRRPCANGSTDREVPAAPPAGPAPTTDCPICGRSAKECNDDKAKGWDNCCQSCDAAGHVAAHRLRVIPPGEDRT